MRGQVPDRRTNGRPGRVDPGDQHQRTHSDDDGLLDRFAIDLGVQQLRDQVISRIGASRRESIDEELDHSLSASLTTFGVVREFEDVAHPAGERVAHLRRNTEDVRDHTHRNLLGVIGGQIGLSSMDKSIDEAIAQGLGHRLVRQRLLWRHPGQDQTPRPGVQGRVGGNRRDAVGKQLWLAASRQARGGWNHRDAATRRESFDVAGNGGHVVVTRRQPRATPAVGMSDRARFTKRVPDTKRVIDVTGVENVVISGPVDDLLRVFHDDLRLHVWRNVQ